MAFSIHRYNSQSFFLIRRKIFSNPKEKSSKKIPTDIKLIKVKFNRDIAIEIRSVLRDIPSIRSIQVCTKRVRSIKTSLVNRRAPTMRKAQQ